MSGISGGMIAEEDVEKLATIIFSLVLIAVVLSPLAAFYFTQRHYKQEAIKHGCAERVMTDSVTGKTEFRWRERE